MIAKQSSKLALLLQGLLVGLVLLALAAAVLHAGSTQEFSSQAAPQGRWAASHNPPLAFESNQGQTDPQVKYLARGQGYTLFLTSSAAVLSLTPARASSPKLVQSATPANLRVQMAGANPQAQVSGEDMLPGVSNYYLGNDRSKWRTGVRQYARVDYRNVYPGVRAAFRGQQGQLEFAFVVAPGADPAPISLLISGATIANPKSAGDLVLSSSAGDLQLHKPVAYQEKNGSRQTVEVRFVMKGENQLGFALGNYDHSRELMIEPTLGYSAGQDLPAGRLASNQAQTLPSTTSTSHSLLFYALSLPVLGLALVGAGLAPRRNLLGCVLVCVALSGIAFMVACSYGKGTGGPPPPPGGTPGVIVYSTYLGGGADDIGHGIFVDGGGNVYVTGESSSSSASFPGTPAQGNQGLHDAFVVKLNPQGVLQYSTFIGGSGQDVGNAITVDGNGNGFIVGSTQRGSGFPAGTVIGVSAAGQDVFAAKFNGSGTLQFATEIGGSGTDSGNAVAVDSNGNVFAAGETRSNGTFPTTVGAFQTLFGGGVSDAFLLELNAGGASLAFSTYLGRNGLDLATGIALDSSGNAYITGVTESPNLATPGAAQSGCGTDGTCNGGADDAFVAEFSSTGSEIYFTYLGGSGGDDANAITVDSTGAAYVTGKTQSTDFPHTNGLFTTIRGTQDAFVTKVAPNGTQFVFSTYLGGTASGVGGSDTDEGLGISLDTNKNIYVTGTTSTAFSTNNPITGFNTLAGSSDAFVTEFNAAGTATPFSTFFGGSGAEDGSLLNSDANGLAGAIGVDSAGNAYITGSTNSSTGFPLTNAAQGTYGGDPSDAFVAKITPGHN